MATKPVSKTKVKVNFEGSESQDFSIPDGPYTLEVVGVEKKTSESSGNEYLAWTYKIAEGKHKGKKVWDNTSLQPQALWRLRNALEAMGVEVIDGEIEIDLNDFEGMIVGANIENEKYKGKDKARIVDFFEPTDDGEADEEEEDEQPAPKPSKKAPAKAEPEEEEEEEKKPVTKKKKTVAKPEFEVGNKVTFEDEGETYSGKIVSIDDSTATVKVGKDDWELNIDELTLA